MVIIKVTSIGLVTVSPCGIYLTMCNGKLRPVIHPTYCNNSNSGDANLVKRLSWKISVSGAICELMVDCLFWSWKIEDKECCAKFADSIVEENDKFISGDLGCK